MRVLFPNTAFLCWGSELDHKCVKSCYLTTAWGGYKLARPQVNMVFVQHRAGIYLCAPGRSSVLL